MPCDCSVCAQMRDGLLRLCGQSLQLLDFIACSLEIASMVREDMCWSSSTCTELLESWHKLLSGEVSAEFQVDSLCCKTDEETGVALQQHWFTSMSLSNDEGASEVDPRRIEWRRRSSPGFRKKSHLLMSRSRIWSLTGCAVSADLLQLILETSYIVSTPDEGE